MKRISVFMLLAALLIAFPLSVDAQRITPAENARQGRAAAKKQQKMLNKANKKQRKAVKKFEKQQRKSLKKANKRLH